MSWHYSQEQEGDFSLQNYLDGVPSVGSSSQSIPEMSCCSDSETECSSHSQSGTMSAPSTGDLGEEKSMSSAEDSPARTSVRRVKVQELPASVRDFGRSISESLERFGLSLSSRKTVRSCEPVDSAPSSKTLTAWGMTCGGECWELGTSVRITRGTECGLWPTPKASAAGPDFAELNRSNTGLSLQTAAALWPTPTSIEAGEGKFLTTLITREGHPAKRGQRAYNPNTGDHVQITLNRAVKMWPTPTARDHKDGTAESCQNVPPNCLLGREVHQRPPSTANHGSLNPTWVEWLMGWPSEWTVLKPLGMDRFQQWLQLHSEFCHRIGSDENRS